MCYICKYVKSCFGIRENIGKRVDDLSKTTRLGDKTFIQCLNSTPGVLRAIGIGRKSHSRNFCIIIDDGLSHDDPRNTPTHWKDTSHQWVFQFYLMKLCNSIPCNVFLGRRYQVFNFLIRRSLLRCEYLSCVIRVGLGSRYTQSSSSWGTRNQSAWYREEFNSQEIGQIRFSQFSASTYYLMNVTTFLY